MEKEVTDLEKYHRLNQIPGFRFESTLAANSTEHGIGLLHGPAGEWANLLFQGGALVHVVSGDLKVFLERYAEQMQAALDKQ